MKAKRPENEVAPVVVSGFGRRSSLILSLLVALTVVYAVVVFVLHDSSTYLPAASEYCPTTTEPCARPDLFAFQVSSGIAISYCGLFGAYVWHVTKRVHSALPSTPEGRLFGYLDESEKLAAVNLSFQIWDFFISLFLPEHCTILFLTHHAMAATVSYLCIQHQVLHFYSVFFLGVTEFSSVFLLFVDLAMFFPPEQDSWFDFWIVMICRPAFAVTFIWYRVVQWWQVSYLLWNDVWSVQQRGTAQRLRPDKTYVLYIFLALNLPLGVLQLYWSSIIFKEAAKVILPA